MVKLKAKGPVEFTRRTKILHESGRMTYDVKTFRFALDNDCRLAIPKEVWDDLRDEYLNKKHGLRYRDYITEL